MKVILNKDVSNLGFKDDVVEVKAGYGRNFLIPKGIATIANQINIKVHSENLKQRKFKLEKVKNDAIEIAERMNESILRVPAKVGESGKIFGSVTVAQISEVLNAQGFDIDRKRIVIKDDIKTLGTYTATVTVHKEVTSDITFEVIKS